jgi:tRNA pseudouridine55 synthase
VKSYAVSDRMKRSNDNGFLVVDKPSGPTSRAIVNQALSWFAKGTPIGHTGTLDPLASGVLVLCVGGARRLAEYVQAMDKVYRAGLRLGWTSDTDDVLGQCLPNESARVPALAEIRAALAGLTGEIEQVPPAYSAAKVGGRRSYELARGGRPAPLASRRVHVYGIELKEYEHPRLKLEIWCGRGTYIRSLARDLGERLQCGALVENLRRTQVGVFSLAEAVQLDAGKEEAQSRLAPPERAVVELPPVYLTEAQLTILRHGRPLELSAQATPGLCKSGTVAVFDAQRRLIAIGLWDAQFRSVRPIKVLLPD